jgi:hypothetical protein
MSHTRRYAVGIVVNGRIESIAQRHMSVREAVGFLRGYNRIKDERTAVILSHPISRAISMAKAKSRSS